MSADMEELGGGLQGLKHKTKEAFYMRCVSSNFTLEILFCQLSASGEGYSGDFRILPCNGKGLGRLFLQK